MKLNSKNSVENDELICPITLRTFHDPVIAGDGHTYERSAIVRWINEHGTSPLTRQQLNVNELQPDDYLRILAAQRQKSIESNDLDIQFNPVAHQNTNSVVTHNYNSNNNQIISTQERTLPNYAFVSTYSTRNRIEPESSPCRGSRCPGYTIGIMIFFFLTMFLGSLLSSKNGRDKVGKLLINIFIYSNISIQMNFVNLYASKYFST